MRKIMPDVVESQPLSTLSHEDTVIAAVALRRDRRIGAILVTNDQALVGIITERDIVFCVVAATRDPETTRIAEVMTTDPDVVAPGADVMTALERMQSGGYRHLPVVDGGALVGIVSIRDIYASVRAELEEAVIERDAYLTSTLDD